MEKKDILTLLKPLKIEDREGAIFESQQHCLHWANKVLPLLKYNRQHYEDFRNNAQYMNYGDLSASRLMVHLNAMMGIVDQAVIELENDIEENEAVEPPTSHSDKKKNPPTPHWYQRPIGLIFIGVITGLIVALIIWLIAHYTGIQLNGQNQSR